MVNRVTVPKMSDATLLYEIEWHETAIANETRAIEIHGDAARGSDGKMPERLALLIAELDRRTQ